MDWKQAMKGLGGASQGGAGNYFGPGAYVAEVVAITRKISQDPKKKQAPLIVAELRVVEVTHAVPARDGLPPSSTVGETCAVIINLAGDYPSLEMGKLKGLLEAILGAGAADGDEAWVDLAIKVTEPPGQTLAGQRVAVRGTPKTTRRGVTITTLTFSPAPAVAETT